MRKFTKMIWAISILLISCGKNIESPKLPKGVLNFTLNGTEIKCNNEIECELFRFNDGTQGFRLEGTDTIHKTTFSLTLNPCGEGPGTHEFNSNLNHGASIKKDSSYYLYGNVFVWFMWDTFYFEPGKVTLIQIPKYNQMGLLTFEGTFEFGEENSPKHVTNGYFKCYQYK